MSLGINISCGTPANCHCSEVCAATFSCHEIHLDNRRVHSNIEALRFAWASGHAHSTLSAPICCWSDCQQVIRKESFVEHVVSCKRLVSSEYQCLSQLERSWYNSFPIFHDSSDYPSMTPLIQSHRQDSYPNPSPAVSWRTAPSSSYPLGGLAASPAYYDAQASPAHSYRTAPSPGYTPGTLATIADQSSLTNQSLYMTMVHERGLILEKDKELNWSDRGQHVEYKKEDKIPLEVLSLLGCSNTARVEAVRCKV